MHYQVSLQSEALGDDVFRLFFCLTVRLFVCLLPETLRYHQGCHNHKCFLNREKLFPRDKLSSHPVKFMLAAGAYSSLNVLHLFF